MTFNPMSLKGKRILVTGASSGIGRETSILLSKLGAEVVLLARNMERLKETFRKLEGNGHSIYEYDLEQLDDIPQLLKTIASEQGCLSGLFHAAGIEATLPLNMIKKKKIETVFKTSAFATLLLAKGFSHKDVREETSSLVFMSSAAGLTGNNGISLYSASKAAVDGAVRALAVELAQKKISVNSIAAGLVRTEMYEDIVKRAPIEAINKKMERYPLGFGYPEDVAMAAAFLLSDASKWITGTTMVVDGGFTISKE
ncbi:MAG: SDR family oxidoreductase [Thermoanaerobacteraceae bacterium]|nr:SDR family oxidoreductase [Thermoanaerobacteraceae bacterium]